MCELLSGIWAFLTGSWDWLSEKFSNPKGDFWSMVQAIAVPVSFWFVWRQIKLQRLGNLAATLHALEDRWQSDSLLRHRAIVNQCFGHGENRINKPEEAVCGFFETLGIYAREEVLPITVIWDSFSYYVEGYWAMLSPHIKTYREEANDITFFTEFEWLATKLEKHGRRRRLGLIRACLPSALISNPELDIKKFIRGETQDTSDILSHTYEHRMLCTIAEEATKRGATSCESSPP